MNIFKEIESDLRAIGTKICQDQNIWSQATVETPKDPLNGDISTNIAMIIASKEKANPKEIALQFKELLVDIKYIAHIEVAGPGFINFTIKAEKWHKCIYSIINDSPDFWEVNVGKGEKVNIEYVSANPTGPMHIGHARGAVYGDALANTLIKCGYDVTKEYYINDAGSQIDTLINSALLRYKEAYTGKEVQILEGLYPGEYLKDVGQKLAEKYSDRLMKSDSSSVLREVKEFIIGQMMNLIKSDLTDLGIHHDIFFSEQSLHDKYNITKTVDILKEKGLIYQGTLPPPKGKLHDQWEEKVQLLFRSSKFGDVHDRPVQKQDGDWSYLASDLAYAKDKIDRGFSKLIYILGADHSGYIKRIKAVISALSNDQVISDVRTTQLVNFMKDGKLIKMSKRSGHFMTVKDVVNDVGRDIIRFMMLTRRNDMSLDFDLDKVKEQSKDNPVFYVQYAHVRTKSIIAKAKENIPQAYMKFISNEVDLSLLDSEEEIQLIKLMASWPKTLINSATYCEPQRIAYYLIDIASRFHAIWNLGKENKDYKFNIDSDIELTAARLTFVESVRKIIISGFEVIGVIPMDKM